jgi:carnitine 3-dehydrogenase
MTATKLLPVAEVHRIGLIGTGSVGASWAALFLAGGYEIVACDPAAGAEARVRDFIGAAWPALRALGIASAAAPPLDRLRFAASPREVAAQVDLVQENAPEEPALKAALLAELDEILPPDKIILSSTGGIPPSLLQASCRHPERVVVGHPFNPPHLIPLVEIVGGKDTAPETIDWALAFFRRLGKHPIVLRREVTGHLANRMQAALLREAIHCLVEGIASAADIDAAVRHGLGARWVLMGSLMTFHLAGGPGGMTHTLDLAADAFEAWWAALGQPHLTPEVRAALIAAGTELQAGRPIEEWIAWRDEKLTGLLAHLQSNG